MDNSSFEINGQRFGKLVVIKRIDGKINNRGDKRLMYLCLCDCGNYKEVSRDCLISNNTRSCGCLKKESAKRKDNKYKTHGMSNTRIYRIWRSMKERCYSKSHIHYDRYGGRGINVCESWVDIIDGFINFLGWANKSGYAENLSLDRIDNDHNYCPENCKWSTPKEQALNRRNSRVIQEANENVTIFSEENGIDRSLIYWRLSHGWSYDDLVKPPRKLVSEKQSGIKGIIWNKKQSAWVVKGIKNGKKDTYIRSFKNLDDAINFKQEYDSIT